LAFSFAASAVRKVLDAVCSIAEKEWRGRDRLPRREGHAMF